MDDLRSNVRIWATAILTHAGNGRKIIFRYAKELRGDFDKQTQPVRAIIAWKYESDNGQPNPVDHQRMNQLEDALQSVFSDGGFSTLALVSTGECLREWIYYAASEAQFMARLNYALTDLPAFPIDIHITSDPNWNTHAEFTESVKES